jgi:hypothetical protein
MTTSARKAPSPEKARLRATDFLLLKESGTFSGYSKSELLDGELWGVIRATDDMLQWDDMVPILLRPIDHELLQEAGTFNSYAKSELIYGEIWVTKSND